MSKFQNAKKYDKKSLKWPPMALKSCPACCKLNFTKIQLTFKIFKILAHFSNLKFLKVTFNLCQLAQFYLIKTNMLFLTKSRQIIFLAKWKSNFEIKQFSTHFSSRIVDPRYNPICSTSRTRRDLSNAAFGCKNGQAHQIDRPSKNRQFFNPEYFPK